MRRFLKNYILVSHPCIFYENSYLYTGEGGCRKVMHQIVHVYGLMLYFWGGGWWLYSDLKVINFHFQEDVNLATFRILVVLSWSRV